MRLTLDISDTLANRLRAEAAARGEDLNNYAVVKLAQPLFFNEEDEWDDADEEDDAGRIAALQEGFAQADRGELLTLEEVSTGVYAALAARREKPAA